ncbi:3-deoxy-D-manno-octulosonic acid transferase [Leptospira wolffii]|uniref:3-deoxy-D-manno-octulosonic acid transferase n=1 Tax=Leptospira wolffii TaxID=409998 RepID=UPI0002F6FAF4|nr:glycosyltransferase N-terminal domain-containing protein [Leptospira wolffii]EPG67677.1 3-deoxy-D-manno-octulosonic-acid transferase [Leptospira wolffii serovar Khorat str. Khorat-H2]TGL46613.1 3-deoxy-D-manno-octulosonic acid transferase [Leptospira wolffii]
MLIIYRILTILLWPWIGVLYLLLPSFRNFLRTRIEDKKRIRNYAFTAEGRKAVWLHAASVGELDQCKALAQVYRKREPDTFLLQSAFSDSVRDSSLEAFPADLKFRLPLDFPGAYDWILDKFRPKVLILMAWDRWPNLLLAAKKRNIQTVLASAVITEPKGFLKKRFYRAVFSLFDKILTSHSSGEEKFRKLLGSDSFIKTLGDSRFDSVIQKIESGGREFLRPEEYPFKRIFLLASTYKPCEDLLLPLLKDPRLQDTGFWIFPHKTDPQRIRLLSSAILGYTSDFSLYSSSPFSKNRSKVILFDVLGILAHAYRAADFAYVGGALHNRVHNVLEPAYFGLPLLTGPRIHHAPEATELQKRGGLFVIRTLEEVLAVLGMSEDKKEAIRKINREFLETGRGAAERIYSELV